VLIDTHCHLDAAEFSSDRDEVVAAASAAGVAAIVVPSVSVDNFNAVRECCARYPGCHPAYGVHPLYVEQSDESGAPSGTAFDCLRTWLKRELGGPCPPVAVGEIGLDYYVPGFDAGKQERFFVEQLRIARDFDLPVLLHVRRAVDPVLKCLRRIGIRRGIAHAFNGSRQQADEFMKLGFKLGFGGAMTFPRATRLRELAVSLPAEAIVLETDAPDIPPAWLDGGRNTPGELARIGGALAELRGIDLSEVARVTGNNAISIMNIPPVIDGR